MVQRRRKSPVVTTTTSASRIPHIRKAIRHSPNSGKQVKAVGTRCMDGLIYFVRLHGEDEVIDLWREQHNAKFHPKTAKKHKRENVCSTGKHMAGECKRFHDFVLSVGQLVHYQHEGDGGHGG